MKNRIYFLITTLLIIIITASIFVSCGSDSDKEEFVITESSSIKSEPTVETSEPTVETSEPTVETSEPTVEEVITTSVNETGWVNVEALNVRSGPDSSYNKIGVVGYGSKLDIISRCSNGWIGIKYADADIAYVLEKYICYTEIKVESNTVNNTNLEYPITYSDDTATITIIKEWYEDAWCYAAHLEFTDYSRFGTTCGKDVYGGKETTSSAAKRVGALLAVNADYASPDLGYRVARSGVVYNDGSTWCEGMYNSNDGIFAYRDNLGVAGQTLSTLVENGQVTDTFQFGPAFLIDGVVKAGSDTGRAQRTSIGTNGNAGDIWIIVSDGRKNDGESSGLTFNQCANYLLSKGCTFGIPLDGGGSSTMVWNGQVLNANKKQREVVDFIYFK